MSTTAFIDSINNLSLPSSTLKPYTTRDSFPEFYSSAMPIFSLSPSVSEPDLISAINQVNQQACSELGFSNSELEEMGLAAALFTPWALHGKEPVDAVEWYLEAFDKDAAHAEENPDPKFYPLGFIGIDRSGWKDNDVGVVLVYFDVTGRRTDDEKVTIKAFRLGPEKMGAAVVSLRQGDDEIDNIRRHYGVQS